MEIGWIGLGVLLHSHSYNASRPRLCQSTWYACQLYMVKMGVRAGNGKNPWSLGRFSPNKWRTVGGGQLRRFVQLCASKVRIFWFEYGLDDIISWSRAATLHCDDALYKIAFSSCAGLFWKNIFLDQVLVVVAVVFGTVWCSNNNNSSSSNSNRSLISRQVIINSGPESCLGGAV